jgi:thioredoxin:protein disulfide reductase
LCHNFISLLPGYHQFCVNGVHPTFIYTNWQPYSQQLMAQAQSAGKPVIIDFSADWCAPCRELDEITFRDPDIVKMSGEKIVMVKVDLTEDGNVLHERLVSQYGIKGVPTVLFFNRQGKERIDLRLVDFLPADQFLIRLADLIKVKSSDSL